MVGRLEKFELYKPFFSKLNGTGEPVCCGDAERRTWLNRLEQLRGITPFEEFDTMVEFMIVWGRVREVLRYGDTIWMVRYEVGGLLYGADNVGPVQLLARFTDDGQLQGYTVIHGRGVAGAFHGNLHVQSDLDKSCGGSSSDREKILEFIRKMRAEDFLIVARDKSTFNIAQVWTDAVEPEEQFLVEWQCGSMMWQCATVAKSREEVLRFFAAYMDEGLPAAQMVFKEWHLVDWYGSGEYNGRSVDIDRYLSAVGLWARRTGDVGLARRLEGLGILPDLESVKANRFEVDLGKCKRDDVMSRLRVKAEELSGSEREKVLLYLELHGQGARGATAAPPENALRPENNKGEK